MADDAMIGTILSDRYRIDALLGEGGMGRVYRGEHVLMRKRVAIKILHNQLMTVPEVVARFEREAMASAHIEHPHVAAATDFGKLPDGSVFLVLEYVEGVSLSSLIAAGPCPYERALRIALQILAALEAAHARGIVHRDLKPDNVLLVRREDGGDFVKVLDFGVAKVPAMSGAGQESITQVGMVYGTPEYMAPEQALGQDVDATADLYALGVLLYEMLAGVRPYEGPVVGLLGQQLTKPLPLMAERRPGLRVPPRVEALVRELLQPDKGQRTPSATAARERIEALLSGQEQGKLDAPRASRLSSAFASITRDVVVPSAVAPTSARRQVVGNNRKIVTLSAGLLVSGLAGASFLFREPAPTEEVSEPLVATTATPAPSPSAQLLDRKAELELAKREGLPALEELVRKYPGEAEAQAEFALALAKAKRFDAAVDAVRLALGLDPKQNDNRAIKGALFRAAQAQSSSVAAFRLLRGPMGAAGADIAFDLRDTEGVASWVKRQSEDFLSSSDIETVATRELLLVLAMERPETCEGALQLVKSAEEFGDERTLPVLRKYLAGTTCARFHSGECFPCLRDRSELPRAIEAVKARAKAKAKP